MSRRVFLLGVGLALVALGLAFTDRALTPARAQITEAAFRRIGPGMPRQEVEAILGGPPGDYMTDHRFLALDIWGNGVLMRPGQRAEWWGDGGIIQVGFDPADRTIWTRFVAVLRPSPQPGPLDRLRAWLGL
jgi:hypothetical protein